MTGFSQTLSFKFGTPFRRTDLDVRWNAPTNKVSKISLSWRNLERHKAYSTANPNMIIKWIREGRAVQGMIRMDAETINWKSVKSVTVIKAELSYYARDPFTPSDWLMPFAALWTTVDTGHGNMDLEIDCPIIGEAKQPATKNDR